MSSIKSKVRSALHDLPLRRAVLDATVRSVEQRNHIVAELPDIESARTKAREIRQRSLDKLDQYLDQFTEAFTKAGGYVHYAKDAEESRRLVIEVLKRRPPTPNDSIRSGGSCADRRVTHRDDVRSHRNFVTARPDATCRSMTGVKRGVKSKSMVSEEIELRQALLQEGINVVESDLGEFIVQIAGESPSHITAPALHRSRYSIGELFAEKLGVPYSDDPETLTKTARKILRQHFLNAEFALSGANFIVAESGHIVLVENENNVRLGLSLPLLYIAVTGIEKVIGSLNDLSVMTDLLPRSATGQRFTGYLHLLKPTQTDEDGPEEMHLILVDNGRRRTLDDPIMREMLLCIRCGACLNICPVYRSVGGHAYGSVYPGPMGAVWSNILGAIPMTHSELPHLSTLCGACRDICPVKIDIPKLLLELRARAPKTIPEKVMATGWKWTMSSSPRYEMAGRLARLAGKAFSEESLAGGWLKNAGSAFREGGEA